MQTPPCLFDVLLIQNNINFNFAAINQSTAMTRQRFILRVFVLFSNRLQLWAKTIENMSVSKYSRAAQ